MKKAVFAIVKSQSQANSIVDALRNAGFVDNDISVLLSDPNGRRDTSQSPSATWSKDAQPTSSQKKTTMGYENNTKAGEGAAIGATAGGILGGTLGLLAGLGTLAIPGVGPFIAAGPILAALSGSAIGGGVGLLGGALTGLGIPEYEVKRYEGALKAGSILISVHCENSEDCDQAKKILETHHAEDISCSKEKAGKR